MKITIGGKDPIIPTVEAIESMQRNVDYWGRRCELAEERLEAAKSWLRACLGLVEGSGPPNWDGIREFLKSGNQITGVDR